MNVDITSAHVADKADMAIGSMKMVRVGGHRVVLVRTATGFHALDNACPHEGYGLVQGGLDGELLTCEWHNWKFNVADGSCVLGEEAVASHAVSIDDGAVTVTVRTPSADHVRTAAAASLDRGIDAAYNGQIARDCLRLLHAGASPVEVVWQAVARTAPRTEDGFNHALAMTTDCLIALADADAHMDGDDRLIPVAQAISGLAESELRRPERPRPVPATATATSCDGFVAFRHLVETEQADAADSLLTGALLDGLGRDEAARWLIRPSCDHHLAFGHGAIYTQKAFEMLDIVGWDRAPHLLAHLSTMHVTSTREDKLPYMRPFLRAVESAGLAGRWRREIDPAWPGRDALVDVLLGTDQTTAVAAAMTALDAGSGVTGVLDAVSIAAAERMLRHDLAHEHHPDLSGYSWLDITHSLTYANAARWAWTTDPGEHTARLAMYTVFHVVDGGRYATTTATGSAPVDAAGEMNLDEAMSTGAVAAAVRAAMHAPVDEAADALVRASLDDRSGALIVVAHHIKVARAAIREAASTGSRLPLAAAARFITAPGRQRFVSNNIARARHFLTTGSPPPR